MTTIIRNSLMSLLLFTLLTGIIYPLAVTGIAQVSISPSGERQHHHEERKGRRL